MANVNQEFIRAMHKKYSYLTKPKSTSEIGPGVNNLARQGTGGPLGNQPVFTGRGPRDEISGTVHKNEMVIPEGMVNAAGGPDNLMGALNEKAAQPDLKGSTALAKRYPGLVAICYYSGPRKSRDIREQEHIVHVNRSYWMDSLISKVKNKTIFLPRDLSLDYREHLKAPIKTYKKDDTGEVYAEFVKKQSSSDHYFHSSVYALIALGRKAGKGQNIYV